MDRQEPRNHGEWCERGHAALRVVTVLQHRAFSALVLSMIILYDRPKRERKARDGAGLQPCWCRPPVAERSRAEAVPSIRRCRGRVPLQSLPRMAVSGLPEVPHAQTAVWATGEHRTVARRVRHGAALADVRSSPCMPWSDLRR
jgi:hypothetical protein